MHIIRRKIHVHLLHLEMDKKHLTDRNQSLSDRLFSQQTDAELQRHIRSNTELKQQHEVLLSTLLLEQQLHSTATNEHKRLVKEVIEPLANSFLHCFSFLLVTRITREISDLTQCIQTQSCSSASIGC